MTTQWTSAVLAAAACASVLTLSGCNQLKARDDLNRGTQAFKNAQYNEAIEEFQRAIVLDPNLTAAKIYLATAYEQQFTPGQATEDNMQLAQNAISEYKVVLDENPGNINAVAGLASLYYNLGDLDNAKVYYTKQMQLNPSDPLPYYSLGVIDYFQVFKPLTNARQQSGITDQDLPLVPVKKATKEQVKACHDLQADIGASVDDGLQQLNKALELKPAYADAMAYMNLLYREKADLTCGDQTAFKQNVDQANDWSSKALAQRKADQAAANAKAGGGGGVTMDGH